MHHSTEWESSWTDDSPSGPTSSGSYITLKGNATGRKNLVKRILAEAGTRKAELEAEDWTFQVVSTRLKNAASKLSKNHWSATA